MKRWIPPGATFALLGCMVLLGAWSREAPRRADSAQEDSEESPPVSLPLTDWPMDAAESRGQQVYTQYCVGCHGEAGLGDGKAAQFLSPLPRNFQRGHFKFRSTPYGQPPLPSDVLRTVTCGLAGSSMPAFNLLPEPKRQDVVAYVLYLASYGDAAREVENLALSEDLTLDQIRADHLASIREQVLNRYRNVPVISVPEEPEATPESIERGKEVYLRNCAGCHGANGKGDGGSSYTMRDWKDAAILPRDFTTGVFRAGSTNRDIYMRLRGGISGTPMPVTSGEPEDLWAIVHFMRTLIKPTAAASLTEPCHEGGR